MKNNYTNQFQRDILGGEDGGTSSKSISLNTIQENGKTLKENIDNIFENKSKEYWMKKLNSQKQSILSIEEKAEKYANKFVGISSTEKIGIEKDFIAGANEMLPIIKELGEALKKTKDCVSELTTLADGYENDYVTIQTTLDKYKDYIQ